LTATEYEGLTLALLREGKPLQIIEKEERKLSKQACQNLKGRKRANER